METIKENSVLLNWNDGSESISPTKGDTTVITKKDVNDELTVDTADGHNTNEHERFDNEAVIEGNTKVGDKGKSIGNHWSELFDETAQIYLFSDEYYVRYYGSVNAVNISLHECECTDRHVFGANCSKLVIDGGTSNSGARYDSVGIVKIQKIKQEIVSQTVVVIVQIIPTVQQSMHHVKKQEAMEVNGSHASHVSESMASNGDNNINELTIDGYMVSSNNNKYTGVISMSPSIGVTIEKEINKTVDHWKGYFSDGWNWLDFIINIVFTSIITVCLEIIDNKNESTFTYLRAFRVLRSLRNITHIESLRIVVETLFESLKKMALAGILLIYLQTVFAMLGVQLLSGRLHNRFFVDSYTIWECNSTNNNINNNTTSIYDSCECIINVTQDTDYNSLSNAIWSNITEEMNYCFGTPEIGNDLCLNQDIRYPQCISIAPNPDSGVTNFDHFGWAFLQTFVIAALDFSQVVGWCQDTFSTRVLFIHCFILTLFLAYVALNIVLPITIYSFQNENESGHRNKVFTILKEEREILTNALKTNNHEQYKEMKQGYDIDIEIETSNDNDNDSDLEIDNKQDIKPEAITTYKHRMTVIHNLILEMQILQLQLELKLHVMLIGMNGVVLCLVTKYFG